MAGRPHLRLNFLSFASFVPLTTRRTCRYLCRPLKNRQTSCDQLVVFWWLAEHMCKRFTLVSASPSNFPGTSFSNISAIILADSGWSVFRLLPLPDVSFFRNWLWHWLWRILLHGWWRMLNLFLLQIPVKTSLNGFQWRRFEAFPLCSTIP